MKSQRSLRLIGLIAALACLCSPCGAVVARYAGMCDASAAVPVGSHYFAVANDKDSVLRVYDRDYPGQPIYAQDFTAFLTVSDPETDLEGATRIGDRIYWITSHSTNARGEPQPSRRRLFATRVQVRRNRISLTAVGVPYRTLVEDLAASKALAGYELSRAAHEPPESSGGLNIEGLSRTPQGGLMIAFRNPRPDGKALLVLLENPGEVVAGKAPKFGTPVLLDLGGRGVRSLEYSDFTAKYLVVGGPHDDAGTFELFEWTGRSSDRPQAVQRVHFGAMNPEALIVYPDRGFQEQFLSDDRGEELNGTRCLRRAPDQQSFRGLRAAH